VLTLTEVPADQLPARRTAALDRVTQRRVTSRHLEPETARTLVEGLAERDGSVFLDVSDDGAVVGSLWLGSDGDELAVYDLVLDDLVLDNVDVAGGLVPLLVGIGRARGSRRVGVGVQPGDRAHRALATLPGFSLRATNMELDLDGEIGDPGELVLEPMTPSEFDAFMSDEVEGFAQELVAAGADVEAARERSRTLMDELVPAGLESPGMEFHAARVGNETVGGLWLSTAQTMAFVYNIEVRPEHRRRGYGAAIMNAAARHCRDHGHPYLGLNVFAHNPGARALYDKLGYRVSHDYHALDVPDAG